MSAPKIDFFEDNNFSWIENIELNKRSKTIDDSFYEEQPYEQPYEEVRPIKKRRSRGRPKCYICKKLKQEGETEYVCRVCLRFPRMYMCSDCYYEHKCLKKYT